MTPRAARRDDARAIVNYGVDPDIERTRWLPIPHPCSPADARRVVGELQTGFDGPFGLTLVISDPETDDFFGVVMLRRDTAGGAEVSYGVAPQRRRRGIATRAVNLIAGWAFAALDVRRLEIP